MSVMAAVPVIRLNERQNLRTKNTALENEGEKARNKVAGK